MWIIITANPNPSLLSCVHCLVWIRFLVVFTGSLVGLAVFALFHMYPSIPNMNPGDALYWMLVK